VRVLGDSWYAAELRVPTLEDEPLPRWAARRIGNPLVRGIALWSCARRYDRLVLSDSGVTFRTVMLLERLRPRRRPYLVLLEFRPAPLRRRSSIPISRRRRWLRAGYQRWIIGPVLRSALERAHTLSSWEVDRNAREFGIARERFTFIPFPLTVAGEKLPPREGRGRRVLASGRTLCDWPLVFAAAEGQSWELVIVCDPRDRRVIKQLNADHRARVWCDIPTEAHQELLRNAAVYLLPLREGDVSSGHIRVFDATRAGAALVTSNVRGLTDYVEHGETALAFPAGDASAARDAVNRLLGDPALADELRRGAFKAGQLRTREDYLHRISQLVHDR
jgi:glycosyltransferase involved in cell wall biosynthesis